MACRILLYGAANRGRRVACARRQGVLIVSGTDYTTPHSGLYSELFPSCDHFYDSHEKYAERAALALAHEAVATADCARRSQVAAQGGRDDGHDAVSGEQGAAGTGVDAGSAALRAFEERHDRQ